MRLGIAVLLVWSSAVGAQPANDLTKEFQAGVDAFRLGKFEEAKAHLEKAKALDPKLPGPNRFLAAVAQAQGRWQDCIDASRKAIELNPRSQEIGETRKLHDECRVSAGRAPFREELGDSAAIAVTTSVAGATVKIGGLNYGGTPLAPRPITAGTLEVDVEKAGWKPVHVSVNALPGIVTDVVVDLEPDPNANSHPDIGVQQPLSTTAGRLVVPADIDAITIDGQVTKPIAGEVEPPGTHLLEVDRAGHDPWRRRVRISAAQKTRVVPTFVETAPRETKQTIGMVLVGGGAAIAVFGFVAALKSSDASAEARHIEFVESSHPPKGEFTRADFNDARDRSKKWSLISTVGFGAALAAFGAGAIYMYFGGVERSDVPPPFAVTPVAGGAIATKAVVW